MQDRAHRQIGKVLLQRTAGSGQKRKSRPIMTMLLYPETADID
jgi:hypothetical protein